MVDLSFVESGLQRKAGARDSMVKQQAVLASRHEATQNRLASVEEARNILQLVAQETQTNFVVRISEIVTAALEAVFEDDAYAFKIDFVQKRGKTEADLYFERGGNRVDPMTASGGGPVDVASFALRVALWHLLKQARGDKLSNTIVLDEPFRFLSKDLQPKAGGMLKMLSDKLGIQFIFVTHVQDLVDSADQVFHVEKQGNVSKVVAE